MTRHVCLLGVPNHPPPTKETIERAFRLAAKRYHPDAQNNHHADPDAERFRQCLEARDLLLDHFHSIHRGQRHTRISTTTNSSSHNHYRYSYQNSYSYWPPPPNGSTKTSPEGFFAKGFPFNTLQLLTTRSKVYIKGTTAVLLLAMGLYDGYSRRQSTNHSAATATTSKRKPS